MKYDQIVAGAKLVQSTQIQAEFSAQELSICKKPKNKSQKLEMKILFRDQNLIPKLQSNDLLI